MTLAWVIQRSAPSPTGCWIWQRARNEHGYGRSYFQGRVMYAHRIAWEVWRGPIPDGMTVDHTCFTRACVNPGHLQLASRAQNTRRRRIAVEGVWECGHPRTAENTYAWQDQRSCLTCRRAKALAYHHRKKERPCP